MEYDILLSTFYLVHKTVITENKNTFERKFSKQKLGYV